MKRYTIHATNGPVTAMVFDADTTDEIYEWLCANGAKTPDLFATDRQEARTTRLQRTSR